jgi:hypothetical protein
MKSSVTLRQPGCLFTFPNASPGVAFGFALRALAHAYTKGPAD